MIKSLYKELEILFIIKDKLEYMIEQLKTMEILDKPTRKKDIEKKEFSEYSENLLTKIDTLLKNETVTKEVLNEIIEVNKYHDVVMNMFSRMN